MTNHRIRAVFVFFAILSAIFGLCTGSAMAEQTLLHEETEVIRVADEPSMTYYATKDSPIFSPRIEKPQDEATQNPAPLLASVEVNKTRVYDTSIRAALAAMSLRLEHLDLWMSVHTTSSLKHLKAMPARRQKEVANIATYIRSHNAKIDAKTAWREAAALVHYSEKYGISSSLAVAVAQAESTFNPNVTSSKGAMGVMQVMWKVHYGLLQSNGISAQNEMFDPEKGIAAGCLLLSRYIKSYSTLQQAINRYYGGTATVYWQKLHRNMAKLNTHSQKSGF